MNLFYYAAIACCWLISGAVGSIHAQSGPQLLFREDWKEIPEQLPINQQHVNHPDLLLHLYGPAQGQIKKSHHEVPANHPYYVWSGNCEGNWAVTLQHKNHNLDLSGDAKIRLRTHQSGFRQLHLLVITAQGSKLVSREAIGPSDDWQETEMVLKNLHWHKINMDRITEGGPVENPDLSDVTEIGFTDLMSGGQSGACSRIDRIEVYGKNSPRHKTRAISKYTKTTEHSR